MAYIGEFEAPVGWLVTQKQTLGSKQMDPSTNCCRAGATHTSQGRPILYQVDLDGGMVWINGQKMKVKSLEVSMSHSLWIWMLHKFIDVR